MNNMTDEQLDRFEQRVMDNETPEQDFSDELDESLFHAQCRWHPVDLMHDYPNRFDSLEEASEWLSDNASYIEEAMADAGRDAIAAII